MTTATTIKNNAKATQLLDELLKDYQKPADILGESGLLKQLTQAVVERALDAELTHHLGYEKHDPAGRGSGNARNGKSGKTLKTEQGPLPIEVPRDRNSTFEPLLVPKGETRFRGFDEKIISMYARGMTTREIQAHLQEIYGVEVSPTLISQITDSVAEEVKLWQMRPLDAIYPIVYLDALMVKARDAGHVINKAVYLAIGVRLDGTKEALGLWSASSEGAKFWLAVVAELKNRGVQDIFIACVDGLKGFPEAIEAVFPKTQVQLCIVHLVRHSLNYVSWKQRQAMAADLKTVYGAATAAQALEHLETFAAKWDATHPTVSAIWRRNWERITPFFGYPADIRKVIYTTNAIESVNMSLRKVTKNRSSFPSDEAVLKLFTLALHNIAKKWTMPIRDWKAALNQFTILFEDRMPVR
ncbi:MAG TPA: IS256 family transposase [Vicinamibacteria bacterium]|nr:IS256 family transposase [Vicinamibacteria bacterium]